MWFICIPDISEIKDLPFYTVTVGLHYYQYPIDRPEGYDYAQFLYSKHGEGILITEGRTLRIPPNSVVFLPSHTPHKYYALTDIWDVRWFAPSGYETSKLLARLGFTRATIFPIVSLAALDELLSKIHMAFQINTSESIFHSASYTYEFIFEFYKQYHNTINTISYQYRKRLTPVIDYIEHNINSSITQDDLCKEIQVSPQHLCRMFKECLSARPMEYIAKTRIKHACELLTSTQESVESISYKVGFQNTNYFCSKFKKYIGMTPSQYRLSSSTQKPQ